MATAPQKRKTGKVMREYKHGELKSGTGGKVKSRKQAIAIAMSESGQSRPKKSTGSTGRKSSGSTVRKTSGSVARKSTGSTRRKTAASASRKGSRTTSRKKR